MGGRVGPPGLCKWPNELVGGTVANLFRLLRASGPSAPDPEAADGVDDQATGAEESETERPEPERLHELDVTGLLASVADSEAPGRAEADPAPPSSGSDTGLVGPAEGQSLEMESLLKALAPPAADHDDPIEPAAWWRLDTAGQLIPRDELPNEPLAALARSATAGLGALVATPLSVDEYAEDMLAGTVSFIVRDDSSDYAWRIEAEWTDSDGRVELLEALSAMFGEPAPIVGLRRLRTRGDIRSGVAQTPALHLSAPNVGGPEPDWERVLATVVPGARFELDEGGVSYRGARIHGMAVACAVDNDEALGRVDRWLGCLLAAAADVS
jgi:hypothetical protein